MKLWEKLSSLISDEKNPKDEPRQDQPERSAQPADGSDTGSGGDPALSPAAANAVLAMLPKGQTLDQFSAGQIQLLNLEAVRADLGDRWSKVEHQVHLLVAATLRRMVTESDIFTQISDYEYLVIFPNLTEQKASALMYVAAAQIRQKLFGHDPAFAEIRLNATVTQVGRDVLDRPPDAVTAIHEAALHGKPAQPAAEAAREQPLISPFAPWTDKYKIVPVEPGRMAEGRIVPDAMRAGGPIPDFSSLADKAPAAANTTAGRDAGWDQGQPAPVAGYPVTLTAGAEGSGAHLAADPARPQRRLPDFSGMKETHLHRSGGAQGRPAAATGSAVERETAQQVQGYPVVPIKAAERRPSYLIEGAPRAQGRMPDFSAPPASPSASEPEPVPLIGGGGVIAPALSVRLDSLVTKAAPFKAVPITRPVDDQAASAAGARVAGTMAGDRGAQAAPLEIEDLQLLYTPLWEVRQQAVTAYRMKVTLTVSGKILGLSEFCATHDDPKLQETISSVILRRLVSQIQQMRGEKKRAIMVAPITRRFIDDESGLRLVLDQLSLLSEQERQLVVLEIGDAYFGSWPALAPRIALIRRICRNVGIRLSLDHKDFQQVAATGANTVAGDLGDHDWPERQALSTLNAFAAGATGASLRSSVDGLNTSSMVIAAVCAGLAYLSGSAIGEGTPQPVGVYPLSIEGFYLQRQAQRLQQGHEK